MYLLLSNACEDEVEAFLNLFTDWWWRGNMITGRVKARLVRGIMNGDQLPLRTHVGITPLLYQCLTLLRTFANCFDVTALLGNDIIPGFVTTKESS